MLFELSVDFWQKHLVMFIFWTFLNLLVFKSGLGLSTIITTTTNISDSITWPPHFQPVNISGQQKVMEAINDEIQNLSLSHTTIEKDGRLVNISLTFKGHIKRVEVNTPSAISFELYTRRNPKYPQYIVHGKIETLDTSNLDITKPVKVIIHGWKNGASKQLLKTITDAYLDVDDINCIAVDWGPLSQSILYPLVVAQTKTIGGLIGDLVTFIIDYGVNPKSVHIIGHSLGAHLAGFAGEKVSEKVGRITGLDPALPGFFLGLLSQYGGYGRLNYNQADFVDVIHTNGGSLGFLEAIGHVDFYPNGGQQQAGCGTVMYATCSHTRAWMYYAESISKCMFLAKLCEPIDGNHESVLMGDPTPSSTRGMFCLLTNDESPFGILTQRLDATMRGPLQQMRSLHIRSESSGCLGDPLGVYQVFALPTFLTIVYV